jgi:hypothetical protein
MQTESDSNSYFALHMPFHHRFMLCTLKTQKFWKKLPKPKSQIQKPSYRAWRRRSESKLTRRWKCKSITFSTEMKFVSEDEISMWVRLSCLCNKLARSRGEKESGRVAMDAAIEIVTVFVLKEEAEEKGPRSRRKRDGCGWTLMTVSLCLSSSIKWPHSPSSPWLLSPKMPKKPKSGWEHFSKMYLLAYQDVLNEFDSTWGVKGLIVFQSKVETLYRDNNMILTPIISSQSGWQWTWSCPELHMGGFRGGGRQFLTFERCH